MIMWIFDFDVSWQLWHWLISLLSASQLGASALLARIPSFIQVSAFSSRHYYLPDENAKQTDWVNKELSLNQLSTKVSLVDIALEVD